MYANIYIMYICTLYKYLYVYMSANINIYSFIVSNNSIKINHMNKIHRSVFSFFSVLSYILPSFVVLTT